MDTEQQLRRFMREELEKLMLPCSFLISYDINRLDKGLRSKLLASIDALDGKEVNESLYCFNGGDGVRSSMINEIGLLLKEKGPTEDDTAIYCITGYENTLKCIRILPNR